MEFNLAQTRVKLEEALERVKFIQQVVMVDLPWVIEVSFLLSFLFPWSFIGCLSMLASHFARSRAVSLVSSRWSKLGRPRCRGGSLSSSVS